ncbi:MAG TPA: cell envelope integrity protein CreD [Bacteroidia bacterium]|nr:cell envelope integrity protein CreD [Bacteroidia bacterium]
MEDKKELTFFEKASNWIRNSITLRLFTIGILLLIMLVPVNMIESLIREREGRQREAQNEITAKWGYAQSITGPVLTIPYNVFSKIYDKNEASQYRLTTAIHYYHFLPDRLSITGTVNPEVRYRGIFEAIVYSSEIEMSGIFSQPVLNDPDIKNNLRWNEAFIATGITDLRGIQEGVKLLWNNKPGLFSPGMNTRDVIASGISVPVEVLPADTVQNKTYNFNIRLKFNGSTNLNFVPLGKETDVRLISPWHTPSFDGAFLPDDRKIDKSGFQAHWNILNLNRSYPQQFAGTTPGIAESAFGVTLMMPVDQYQKSMRAAKYAVLFISLTFMVFFFIQIINKVRIHPIQYILVGFALCIFYALLISLSEHINFGFSYLISSTAIIALITFYAQGTFKNRKLSGLLSAIMVILYGFIFTIIQLEDVALLVGSIGLLIALAIVMIVTRNIDWYNSSQFIRKKSD